MSSPKSPAIKWQFASRFRRAAFGWRSDLPIQRITEALREIKVVHKSSPVEAAIGSIIFLEKVSTALEQVDSSSGALGSAVNHAISVLVPIIASADVDVLTRKKWLDRLWQAFQADEMPYIEHLADYWGELCVSPVLVTAWADELLPGLLNNLRATKLSYSFFKGTTACLSCLFQANRYEEVLELLSDPDMRLWDYQLWGVKALLALGKEAEALRYAEKCRGQSTANWVISRCCESILLSSGRIDEAYARYAIAANQSTTHLATFRAIVKKYPSKSAVVILRDLIDSTPTAQGKWFAAAKSAGLYELAIEVVKRSATDPRTLIRAARDFADKKPAFAADCALAALHWIANGHGYEITRLEVREALDVLLICLRSDEVDAGRIRAELDVIAALPTSGGKVIADAIKTGF
jgi:tetratricopeptide (TPR) repeat protein